MVPYIIVYALIFLSAFITKFYKPKKDLDATISFFLFAVLLLFIGLRHEVGGDWSSYMTWYQNIEKNGLDLSIKQVLTSDFGYNLANWFSAKLGFGIYGVNTICAFIFLIGLFKFSSLFGTQKYDGLLIAYPYLTMVVAMGYTRQAAAMGFVFMAYYKFLKKKYNSSYILSFLATFFHKSSLLILPFLMIISPKRRYLFTDIVLYSAVAVGLIGWAYQEILERFYKFYVESQMSSEGGLVRGLMNFIPAAGYILTGPLWKDKLKEEEKKFWFWTAVVVVILVPLSFAKLTFADRMLLYFSVIQIFFFVRVYDIFKEIQLKGMLYFSVIGVYTSSMVVWLFFAVHREAWIPYSNLIIELLR